MKDREIEIKIRIDNPENFKEKILGLGGKKTYESLEKDVYFDNDSGFYKEGKVLRIRTENKGTLLTYKDPQEKDNNLIRRGEIQTYVDDPDAIAAMVAKLGFRKKYIKEKRVENYELDGLVIEFHKVPFLGDFIEIEADEDILKNFLPKVGLSLELGIPKGYRSLFEEYLTNHELPTDLELTFAAEKEYLQK